MECPFRLREVCKDGVWRLSTINGGLNHAPSVDMAVHPSLRRMSGGVRKRIGGLMEEGLTPAGILGVLRGEEQGLRVMLRDVYDVQEED